MLNEISSATREQSAGILQVKSAVSQLDQVTQQNVALAELGAGASDTLKGEEFHSPSLASRRVR